MNSLSVDDNIQNILNIKKQLENELLKLEGSLKVYEEMKNVGISVIQLPNQNPKEFELENTEVIDSDTHDDTIVSE
jgi:hypothetical protein